MSKWTKSDWTKLPAIEGKVMGCLNCGAAHDALPMDAIIGVGFGAAGVTCDGAHVWSEDMSKDGAELWQVSDAERSAEIDPDHDWRIFYHGPLSDRVYQRHGPKHWVLIEQGMGFA